jgi:hypothetical protein
MFRQFAQACLNSPLHCAHALGAAEAVAPIERKERTHMRSTVTVLALAVLLMTAYAVIVVVTRT